MDLSEPFIAPKLLPYGAISRTTLRFDHFPRRRIGEEIELAPIESKHLGQARDNALRRMALAGLEMAHVRDRRPDTPRDFFLRQIELTTTLPNRLAKAPLLFRSHRRRSLRSPHNRFQLQIGR